MYFETDIQNVQFITQIAINVTHRFLFLIIYFPTNKVCTLKQQVVSFVFSFRVNWFNNWFKVNFRYSNAKSAKNPLLSLILLNDNDQQMGKKNSDRRNEEGKIRYRETETNQLVLIQRICTMVNNVKFCLCVCRWTNFRGNWILGKHFISSNKGKNLFFYSLFAADSYTERVSTTTATNYSMRRRSSAFSVTYLSEITGECNVLVLNCE